MYVYNDNAIFKHIFYLFFLHIFMHFLHVLSIYIKMVYYFIFLVYECLIYSTNKYLLFIWMEYKVIIHHPVINHGIYQNVDV